MAKLHFVSGKGGVGKSTFASALSSHLEKSGEGPVLHIEVQGSGHSLRMLGLSKPSFVASHVPRHDLLWASHIQAKDSFRQYFEVLIGLGEDASTFVPSSLKEKFVALLLENKIVSAFVDVCPGLEPAVLLGKLHWEATQGYCPEENIAWKHVVVDAPATGHGIMLFKSTFALTEVFTKGTVFKQAQQIKQFFQDPQSSAFYLVGLPEELPLQESLELQASLSELGLPEATLIINRYNSDLESDYYDTQIENAISQEWKKELRFERESIEDARELLSVFLKKIPSSQKIYQIPEIPFSDVDSSLEQFRKALAQKRTLL